MMRRRSRRSQSGVTLIEVLITMAISLMVSIPLLAWMVVGFKTETVVNQTSVRSRSTNQLVAYFPRDIASSSQVVLGGPNCSSPGPSETVSLSIVNGTSTRRTVYYVVPGASGTEGSLRRRTCTVAGSQTDDIELVSGVVLPVATGAVATCSAIPSRHGDPCGRADLVVSTRKNGRVTVTGSRRIGLDQ